MKKKLYCFDFDGTLTTSDTLLEFIKYAKGKGRFLMVFLMYSPLLVLMKLHLYPNWKAKATDIRPSLRRHAHREIRCALPWFCRRESASAPSQRYYFGT